MKPNIFGLDDGNIVKFTTGCVASNFDPDAFITDLNYGVLAKVFEEIGLMKSDHLKEIATFLAMQGAVTVGIEDDPIRSKLFQPLLDVDEQESLEQKLRDMIRTGGVDPITAYPNEIRQYFKRRTEIMSLPYEKKVKEMVVKVIESLNEFADRLVDFSYCKVDLKTIQEVGKVMEALSDFIAIEVKDRLQDLGMAYSEALKGSEPLIHDLMSDYLERITDGDDESDHESSLENGYRR